MVGPAQPVAQRDLAGGHVDEGARDEERRDAAQPARRERVRRLLDVLHRANPRAECDAALMAQQPRLVRRERRAGAGGRGVADEAEVRVLERLRRRAHAERRERRHRARARRVDPVPLAERAVRDRARLAARHAAGDAAGQRVKVGAEVLDAALACERRAPRARYPHANRAHQPDARDDDAPGGSHFAVRTRPPRRSWAGLPLARLRTRPDYSGAGSCT